jgi:uncharacterized protein YjbJ (UPF0337 family)
MENDSSGKDLSRKKNRFLLVISCIFLLAVVWINPVLNIKEIAKVVSSQPSTNIEESDLGAIESNSDSSFANQIALGSGSSEAEYLKGKVEKSLGGLQRKLGKSTGQVEGAKREFQGDLKKNIGKSKGQIDEVVDRTKNVADRKADEAI